MPQKKRMMIKMKKILFLLLIVLFPMFVFSQTIMSWNIQNLGQTKFQRDTIIPQIATADIIAIQEVVTRNYGDSCVIQIAKIMGYNYIISEITTGNGSERYAFLWRKDIKLNWAKLDKDLEDVIDREPFIGSFNYKGKEIVLRQVHLVPTAKNPKKEVVHLYKYKDGIICGDFNLSCKDAIYKPLLSFFNTSNFCGNGTSLKRDGTVSTNNYDHFFVGKGFQVKETKIYFYDYKWDRNSLSDHLPIILILK
jgi:deoxyribonuclease-1-like protein